VEFLSSKNSSKKLKVYFIYYYFSMFYNFSVTDTASAKYRGGILKKPLFIKGFLLPTVWHFLRA